MVPLSDLQRAPGKWLKKSKETNTPLLITQRGRPAAVLLSYPQYENLAAIKTSPRKEALLKELDRMLPIIIRQYKPEKVILFGSLVRGEVTEKSDIDLVIIKKTKKRFIERQLALLNLVHPTLATDFFIYTPKEFKKAISEKRMFFVKEIVENGTVLYGQDQ